MLRTLSLFKQHAIQRSAIPFPLSTDRDIVKGGPIGPLYRGVLPCQTAIHLAAFLFGHNGRVIPVEPMTRYHLVSHKYHTHYVSLTSSENIAERFANSIEGDNIGVIFKNIEPRLMMETIATEKTVEPIKALHGYSEAEYTVLFLMFFAIEQLRVVETQQEDILISNPFFLRLDEKQAYSDMLKLLQKLHEQWYAFLVQLSAGCLQLEEIHRLLTEYIHVLHEVYQLYYSSQVTPLTVPISHFSKHFGETYTPFERYIKRHHPQLFNSSRSIYGILCEGGHRLAGDACMKMLLTDPMLAYHARGGNAKRHA